MLTKQQEYAIVKHALCNEFNTKTAWFILTNDLYTFYETNNINDIAGYDPENYIYITCNAGIIEIEKPFFTEGLYK